MFFIASLILITAALAACGAYFSIYGLMLVFSGAPISVAIMGTTLEAGKLVAASFLYRLWHKCNLLLKTYLIVAIITLMAITSAGIFGYLSAAYQQENVGLADTKQQMVLLSEEQGNLEERLKGINIQIESIPEAYVSKRMQLIATFKSEKDNIVTRLDEISKEKKTLTSNQIIKSAKVGPIVFIAEALGKTPDFAITILVAILTLVFDPLAIALTLATNIAIKDHFDKKQSPNETPKEKEIVKDDTLYTEDSLSEVKPQPKSESKIEQLIESLPEISKELPPSVQFDQLTPYIPSTNPEPFLVAATTPESDTQNKESDYNILKELEDLRQKIANLSSKSDLSSEEQEEKARLNRRMALLEYIGNQDS